MDESRNGAGVKMYGRRGKGGSWSSEQIEGGRKTSISKKSRVTDAIQRTGGGDFEIEGVLKKPGPGEGWYTGSPW